MKSQIKVKVTPEDFVVEEQISLPVFSSPAPFRLYRLEKTSWNTLDAIRDAARDTGTPLAEIRYGGKKDRHARTIQYLTTPARYNMETSWKNVSCICIGWTDDQMSPHYIDGNRFSLVLRDIDPVHEAHCMARLLEIRDYGFANYFDEQRFGSVGNDGAFFAERLVKGEYNGALRLYFTSIHPETPRAAKERKAAIDTAWGDWGTVLDLCDTAALQRIATALARGQGKDRYVDALRLIPKEELSLFIAAWQSFIWNETLSRLLPEHVRDLHEVKGRICRMLHFRNPGQAGPWLARCDIPTIAAKLAPSNEEVRSTLEQILAERHVKRAWCNLRDVRQSFFSSFLRKATVLPEETTWERPAEDDLYPEHRKIALHFTLPRGSYATMLVKSLLL